ncbi:hypothetical membrane protein [Thermococcus kodakarensis KOD1]|uniref:Hypothetical membrane protein n=2 Tax=Thermococcus TaxID=2263 RepID=Q5JI48_THEKO|nr:hypothetical membrane protein [Thermococcus kodakarensis KOD1]
MMNTKRVQRFITGSGMGTLVSFVIIVTQYQESVSPRISLTTILIGMIVVGTLFETKVSKDFLSAPISYISGIGAVFLVAALSYWNKDIPGSALLLVVAVSSLPTYFFRPLSLLDAFISGPEYFGGAITGLAIVGAMGLITAENAFGITFVAITGALVVEGISVFLAIISREFTGRKKQEKIR